MFFANIKTQAGFRSSPIYYKRSMFLISSEDAEITGGLCSLRLVFLLW